MAIYIIDGKPRHGKTAWLINEHINGWLKDARDHQFKVFSNVYIIVKNIRWIRKAYKEPEDCIGDIEKKKDRDNPKKLLYYWTNIDEWNLMKHGRIIVDEATRYFNSRQWQLLSPETEIKLQQHGKDDLDCWLTTQHWTRMDASLRVLTESFFRVERVWGWGNTTLYSKISEHQLEDLERWERNPAAFERVEEGEDAPNTGVDYDGFFPHLPFQKPLYDTLQPVGHSRAMELRHIERFCEHVGCKLHKKPKIVHV